MPVLNIPTPLNTIIAFAKDKPLSDPGLPTIPVALQLPTQSESFDVPDPANAASKLGSFSVTADASTSVAIVNSDSDPDPAGYFNLGGKALGKQDAGPALEPPVVYDPALAYVVITGLAVSGKLSGKFTIGTSDTLGLDGSSSLEAGACMAFRRDTGAWSAVSTALSQFKSVFSAKELVALAPMGAGLPTPWQVLTYGVQGSLNLSLKITAASLAGAITDSVNAALQRSGPFRFDAAASATLSVIYAASDGFRIFAHRAAPGALTFSFKKSSSTSLGLNAGVGLTVQISEEDLTNLLNSVFEQANGLVDGKVAAFLRGEDPPALQELLTKLGVGDVVGKEVDALKKKLGDLHDALTKRLTPVVTAQFTYSWQRITTESLVAQFTVPDGVLAKYHADILSLDLNALLDGAADGIVFARLLGQKVQEVDVGFGFSFGLGSFAFKSWDALQTKFVEQRTLAPNKAWLSQYSFLGKRSYSFSWKDTSVSNYVELDASMAAPSPNPVLGDFHPALSVQLSWTGKRFGDILQEAADFGAVIDAFDSDDVNAAQKALLDAGLDANASGDALVALTIDHAALLRFLPVLIGKEDYLPRIAPYAMARALPFDGDFAERTFVDRRTTLYGQVFANFLATEDLTENTIERECQAVFGDLPKGAISPELKNLEENSNRMPLTAQGVVFMANSEGLQHAMLTELPACFAGLAQATGDFRKVFPGCVDNFSTLAAQGYGTRIFASVLLLAAQITTGSSDLLSRIVQFTWTVGGTRRTVVVRKGNT